LNALSLALFFVGAFSGIIVAFIFFVKKFKFLSPVADTVAGKEYVRKLKLRKQQ
jgi:hypothetical protein